MSRDIEQAHERFTAAEKVSVSSHWVAWPEYERFVAAQREVEKLFESGSLAFDIKNERDWYWALRRAISSTPLHPSEFVGEVPYPAVASLLQGQVLDTFEVLRKCFQALLETENPFRQMLWTSIEKFASIGKNQMQVLVPRQLVTSVDNLFEPRYSDLDLHIEVLDATRAKRSNIADAVFIFGSPERQAGWFKSGIERSREVAWIFNAPSAREIVQFQLADGLPFNSSNYEVWDGAQQFVPKLVGSKPLIDLPQFEQILHIDEVREPSYSVSDPVVDATLVHLLDGRYVYYSDVVPPRPICVRNGESSIEIDDDLRVSSLRAGDVLLIRTGSASRSYLRHHAMTWLLERYEQEEIDSFFGIIETYKNALKSKYGSRQFIADAVRKGLKEHYVQHQILRSFSETTIATQRPENFITIAQTLGLGFGEKEWKAVSQIQVAHRKAGTTAVSELQENVINDESWLDIVSGPGIATLNSGSAGEIVLIPVISTPSIKHQVSLTELGRLKINRRIPHE